MNSLPARLDDAMLARLDAYAAAPLPALPKTDEQHMLQFMRLLSTMPRSKSDVVTSELRIEMMLRMLGHLPKAAIDWMGDQALRRFAFHPSIKELLDLSAEWTRSDESVRARVKAKTLARNEREARMDEAMAALQRGDLDDETVSGWSDWWKQIAQTRGLITIEDGRCRIRASAIWRPVPPASPEEVMADLAEQFPSNR